MEKTALDATERRRRIAGACLIFARVMPRPLVVVFAVGAILFPVGRILLGPVVSVGSDR